jgi:hypothetical protein
VVRPGEALTLTTRLSTFAGTSLGNVEIEYFVDDLVRTGIPTVKQRMTEGADGTYSATLPLSTKDSMLVRYRILADRGGALGVVAPRASDPLPWFSVFVSPKVFVKPGVETKERTYHLWIRPADWTLLEKWIAPGRSSAESPTSRDCIVNPDWDRTVPATFIFEGKTFDVRVRYQGSRSNRTAGQTMSAASWPYPRPNPSGARRSLLLTMNAPLRVLSWRVKFPRYDRFEGKSAITLNKMYQGIPGTVTSVEGALFEKAGVPSYQYHYARLHIDGGYYGYMGQPEDVDEESIARIFPGEPAGDLFKNEGASRNDGPITRGDFKPLDQLAELCPGVTPAQAYAATYERKTYEWRGHAELIKLIEDLEVARKAGVAAVKKHFQTYWDIPRLAAGYAVRKWAGAWDDFAHNMFVYKRANGKWIVIHQDYEIDMGLGSRSVPHTGLRSSWDYNETLYQGWSDVSMQTCELPGVATSADAAARGCTLCHGAGRAMPLMLPTQITTPESAAKVGCWWGGLPAITNAAMASARGCSTFCHVATNPQMALTLPTKAYDGNDVLRMGCRDVGASAIFDAFVSAYKDELDRSFCRLTLDGTLSEEGVLKLIDAEAARLSLDDWLAGPAIKQFCAKAPPDLTRWDCDVPLAHDRMRAWARGRYQVVMQRLKCR